MTEINDLDKPRRGDEKDCPRCGTRIVWTGYYSFDGHWEHCDEGTSGTLSCPFDPAPSDEYVHAWADGYQAGLAAAAKAAEPAPPVCDWCDEPVVLTDSGWCHKSDGLYGCGRKPFNTSAQVHGLHRPVAAS